MKRMEAGSGRDLADIEMPVRLFEIEEDLASEFPDLGVQRPLANCKSSPMAGLSAS
jgi:hypothetical protein